MPERGAALWNFEKSSNYGELFGEKRTIKTLFEMGSIHFSEWDRVPIHPIFSGTRSPHYGIWQLSRIFYTPTSFLKKSKIYACCKDFWKHLFLEKFSSIIQSILGIILDYIPGLVCWNRIHFVEDLNEVSLFSILSHQNSIAY